MKANRQKATKQANQGRKDGRTRTTLRELAGLYPLQEVQLVCNQELNVVVEKIRGRFGGMNARRRNQPVRVEISIGEGSTSLRECFAMVEQGSIDEYILVACNQISQNQCKPFSDTSQKSSQTSLKKNIGWRTSQQYNSQQFINQENPAEIHCFRESKIYVPEEMSVVEEIPSESVQSDYTETPSCNQPSQTNNILQNDIGDIKAKYLQQALHKDESFAEKLKPEIEAQNLQVQQRSGERFSFTKRMKNGMMSVESIQMEDKNYGLAEQEEFQLARLQINHNIPSQSLGMNSILSIQPAPAPKETQFPPKNSESPKKLPETKLSQRIQLSQMAKQHEEHSKDIVQITQKSIEPNRSEFYVRYNFRFLEKKSIQTDVMRISPLKFRKIQGVTRLQPQHVLALP